MGAARVIHLSVPILRCVTCMDRDTTSLTAREAGWSMTPSMDEELRSGVPSTILRACEIAGNERLVGCWRATIPS